jgi:hypothetical protein
MPGCHSGRQGKAMRRIGPILFLLAVATVVGIGRAATLEVTCIEASKYKHLYKIFGGDARKFAAYLQIDPGRLPGPEHCRAALITGRIEKRQASYEMEISDIEQPVITSPDLINVGETLVLNAGETYLPGMEIGRYYWNFGDETVATGLEASKVYQVPGKYNIQLIVSSVPGAGGVVREVCVCKDIEVAANGN